jgi:hypothetical protein
MSVMVWVVRGEGGRGERGGGRQRRRNYGLVRIAGGGVGREGTTDALVASTFVIF